ncbi:hypothetical protein [Breznakiella homolactica]|uniref:DUF5723 domain-containing protein n=1 Tax=Breznakiella homolactica TaxID=2798577 RepID=A0A7T7XKF6_9SPIR|nr:hypothetical protein [Breznakiella homolactica]QQO07996.1 hypothetical protein JFL75_13720 [Breznakiella homolactica]
MKKLPFLLFCLLCSGTLFAWDYGLVLNQTPKYTHDGFEYVGTFTPWVSALFGDNIDLYVSGFIKLKYEDDEFSFIPDLGRTEVLYRHSSGMTLGAGRMDYMDPAGMVASGLYDGFSGNFRFGNGLSFRANALYSGLVNKKNAEIVLSPADADDFADDDRFLAPSRALASGILTIPGLFGVHNELSVGLIGQFDLGFDDIWYHSQYLSVNYDFNRVRNLELSLDLSAALAEYSFEDETELEFTAAASLEALYRLPVSRPASVFAGVRWASGDSGPFSPYKPVNVLSQGKVFTPNLSGLTKINLGAGVRVTEKIYTELLANYFLRTDMTTVSDEDIDPDSDSYALGGEIYASLIWAPVSDVSFILGGGAFLPQLGDAFVSDADVQWLVSLAVVLSL